jgi:hypothetical protein
MIYEMSLITKRTIYSNNLEIEHYIINLIFHDFKYIHLDNEHSITDQANMSID